MWIVPNINMKVNREKIESGILTEVPDERGARLVRNGKAVEAMPPIEEIETPDDKIYEPPIIESGEEDMDADSD